MTRGRHLLVNGHLRCGACGAAMIPRTGTQKRGPTGKPHGQRYEVYLCAGRQADVNSCDQLPVKREVIDTALLDYLTTVALDVEQTKRQYIEATSHRMREAAELRAQAEHELMRSQAARQRTEDDYLAGRLDADRWQRLDDRLSSECSAADAKLDRLTAQEAAIGSSGLQDAEEAVLRRFADLRRAVSGEIASAQDVAALRAVLTRLFERFELRSDRGAERQRDLLEGGDKLVWQGAYIKPIPRPDAIIPGLHPLGWEPRRVALELAEHREEDKYANGLATKSSAPRSNARTRSSSDTRPESTISGSCGSSREATPSAARTRVSSSIPEPSGSPRSRIARSGRRNSSSRRPSCRQSASTSSKPSAVRLSARNVLRTGSSSTSSRVGVSGRMPPHRRQPPNFAPGQRQKRGST
jgi:hypothetical protein